MRAIILGNIPSCYDSALPDLSDIQSNQLVSITTSVMDTTLLSSGPYLLQNTMNERIFMEDLNDLCENFADKGIPKGSFREWRQAQLTKFELGNK